MSEGWDILGDTLAAIGHAPEQSTGGAVGLGSVAIPGTRRYVDQLREFIRQGCQVATPLGNGSLNRFDPHSFRENSPGKPALLLLGGRVGEEGSWQLLLPVPEGFDSLGRIQSLDFGSLQFVFPTFDIPTMSWNELAGIAEIRFAQPITVRKAQTAGLFGRRMSWITAQLRGIDLHAEHGDLVFENGFVDWLAPRLRWGD